MTKPRKKYKHDPGRKYEHPALKRAEAAGLERWRVKHFELMDSYQEGEPRAQMIVTLADVIAPAIKSMEGWADPDDVGSVMVEAMDALMRMAKDGYRWDTSAVPLIKEATSCAIQITNGMPVSQIAKAVFWARQITAKTAREVAEVVA